MHILLLFGVVIALTLTLETRERGRGEVHAVVVAFHLCELPIKQKFFVKEKKKTDNTEFQLEDTLGFLQGILLSFSKLPPKEQYKYVYNIRRRHFEQ